MPTDAEFLAEFDAKANVWLSTIEDMLIEMAQQVDIAGVPIPSGGIEIAQQFQKEINRIRSSLTSRKYGAGPLCALPSEE